MPTITFQDGYEGTQDFGKVSDQSKVNGIVNTRKGWRKAIGLFISFKEFFHTKIVTIIMTLGQNPSNTINFPIDLFKLFDPMKITPSVK